MATMNVNLKNGKFDGVAGPYVISESSDHVVGNGWDCVVQSDGTIVCQVARNYSDGEHKMCFTIKSNGRVKLTLKTPHENEKILRAYFIKSGGNLPDGRIGLAGGYVDDRYAYFREESFQNFLTLHGITAMKHEDPNRSYEVRNARHGQGDCKASVQTDGSVTQVGYNRGKTEEWEEECRGTCAYEGVETLLVSGATWAIHRQIQHEYNSHNCAAILYTLVGDPTRLCIPLEGNKSR